MLTQRLGSLPLKEDCYIENMIKIIKENPGSCDEVWFPTDYGYPSLDTHLKTAEKFSIMAEKLKDTGVRISMQLSNTIGHGDYMQSRDCSALVFDGSPAEYMVGDDGSKTMYSFCWRGEFFTDYIIKTAKIYAEKLKPYAIWIDDDLRAPNHYPVNFGCFCDSCIAKFNTIHGTDFSREQLSAEIKGGNLKWRKAYIEFIREGMYDFIYKVCRAINEVSPDTIVSLQHGPYYGYHGGDTNFMFDAMKAATGKNPGSRPGGGPYDDYNPNDVIMKGDIRDLQNRTLPDYVTEIRPEIENLPDVTYGKSIPGTCLETTYYFATGSTAMSYAMATSTYEPFSWHGEMMAAFSKHRKYWEKLANLNKITKQDGVHVIIPEHPFEAKCENYGNIGCNTSQEAEYRYITMPISYYKGGDVFILTGDNAALLSDEEITHFLSKPVMTDAKTIEILTARGFDTGITVTPINTSRVHEIFESHTINNDFCGEKSGGKFLSTNGYYINGVSATAECLGRYNSNLPNVPEAGKIANAVITTPAGGKWVVLGFNDWNKVISNSKRNQLLNAIEYISGKPLSARMITPFKSVVLPRTYKDGGLACVSILNCTVGTGTPEIRLNVPAGTSVTYMSQYDPEAELTVEKGGIVRIPSISPWSVGTLFINK